MRGVWRSFSAAFTSASLINPPPLTSHLFHRGTNANNVGTLFSAFNDVDSQRYLSSNSPLFFLNKFRHKRVEDVETNTITDVNEKGIVPRIAIIGGGIAGVTAASAIAKHLQKEQNRNELSAKIVLFEADIEGGQRSVPFESCQQPIWTAGDIVPGAAMHIMSQRSTLGNILTDTCQEIFSTFLEKIRSNAKNTITYKSNIDNFDVKPPYFALHLIRCIGPSATWDERATFVDFLRHFLITSLLSGEHEAHERGKFIQELAKSNRLLFLEALNNEIGGKDLSDRMGSNKGFLSLHRTREAAMHAEKEGKDHNETSEMIPIEEAIKLEPRISNLPMSNSLFAVHRKDDYTANSAVFVQDLVNQIKAKGVEYRCGDKGMIRGISTWQVSHKHNSCTETGVLTTTTNDSRFRITTEDGTSHNFDYVVLAAGVNTPLLARKLAVENAPQSIFRPSFCPTYPLRGYSLTVYTNHTTQDGNERTKIGRSSNLLNMPISVDDMYCSSVGVNMARIAGFGELVGYRDKAENVPSLAPKVMARYAKAIFPESDVTEEAALQCFRPMTPDDIPLVGGVSSVPGLYLHTGHGTLGWTLSLATAECVAQAVCEDIDGRKPESVYRLPGDVTVERAKLSPDRFL
ncbi:hypothetical protein HJC23_002972 [Cyclotella cryptica]|uniref:FAD dependent oxidoreductase domain-containing protein n=1 Tax=Cyclotella cryptica TaxID=29204 RepID=A0ABD3PE64_9STRA